MDAAAQGAALERAGRLDEALAVYRQALEGAPDDAGLLHRAGCVAMALGRLGEAAGFLQKSLGIRQDPEAYIDFGALLRAVRHWDAAAAAYEAALRLAPGSLDARYGLGLVRHRQDRPREAEQHYRAVLTAQPALGEVQDKLGLVLQSQGRFAEAVAAHREAARLNPRDAGTWDRLGAALQRRELWDEAERAHRTALALDHGRMSALHNLAFLHHAVGRGEAARAVARRLAALGPDGGAAWRLLGTVTRGAEAVRANGWAVRLAPDDADARNNLANALGEVGRLGEAVAEYRALLRIRPDFPVAELNLAQSLRELRDGAGALAVLRGLVGRHPATAEAWRTAGLVLMEGFRPDAGVRALRRAVALEPAAGHLHLELGSVATQAGLLAPSIAAYRRALAIEPGHGPALGHLVERQKLACDWHGLAELERRLVERVRQGADGIPPFALLSATGATLADQQRAARGWARVKARGVAPAVRRTGAAADGRLRLGYLSANFHEHAVAHLVAEALELHDRARFAVTGYSLGPDDGSALRARLIAGMERFVDLRGQSDAEAAQRIADDGIDILVDLMGYTGFARAGIVAARPAPLQVGWLGYPGTMGAGWVDAVIADAVTVPHGEEGFYDEAVVRLPGAYQPNDRRRAVAATTPARAACGLPEDGVVFCCFNSPYKIMPALFDVWARVLHAVPGSVLWLYAGNPLTAANLRREGAARGLAPERLVIAPPLPQPDHLARHRLADLFLDTLPYNAHTTASDALWAGLPVLTCRGPTFAGRVAASLLEAAGLPELVTGDLGAYEALAIGLAREPARLAGLRATLAAGRDTCALFDTPRFVRGLEAAFETMWRDHRRKETEP